MSALFDAFFAPSLAEVGALFFRSFLLSQGDLEAQQRLFLYIALCHPEWSLGADMIEQLKQHFLPRFYRYLSHGWHNTLLGLEKPDGKTNVEQEIATQLIVLAGALNNGCPMPRERLLEVLFEDVVENDYLYLIKQGGRARPGRATSVAWDSIHAPFFSHFCQFGVLARPTGAPLYDQLFVELASAYTQRSPLFWEVMKRGETAFRLERVLDRHNQAYPELRLEAPGFTFRKP